MCVLAVVRDCACDCSNLRQTIPVKFNFASESCPTSCLKSRISQIKVRGGAIGDVYILSALFFFTKQVTVNKTTGVSSKTVFDQIIPVTVNQRPGLASAARSVLILPTHSIFAGKSDSLVLHSKDRYGNFCDEGGLDKKISASIHSPGSPDWKLNCIVQSNLSTPMSISRSNISTCAIQDRNNGQYWIEFKLFAPGNFTFRASLGGDARAKGNS